MKATVAIVAAVMTVVPVVWAGDGRREISQADMGSPPYLIEEPGSYVVTENLSVTGDGVHGIEVRTNSVILDLNGFTLQGPGTGGPSGIYHNGVGRGFTVRNGIVRGWGASGAYGVEALGYGSRIENVTSTDNANGLYCAEGGTIGGCSVIGCNVSDGFTGIRAYNGCTVIGCTVARNSSQSLLYALEADYGGTVLDCSVSYNTAASTFRGIYANAGATVSRCTVYGNESSSTNGSGIYAGYGVTVVDCTVGGNACDGILAYRECLVRGNTVYGNGRGSVGDGILVWEVSPAYDNRIEKNNVTRNEGLGIKVQAGNLVIGNSARGNASGNYDISAGQHGPIIPAAAGEMTNENPWANFEY